MAKAKKDGAILHASMTGHAPADIPLKAVAYDRTEKGIRVIAETPVKENQFELDLGRKVEELPETIKLSVVPAEVKVGSQIERLGASEYAPTASVSRETILANQGQLTEVQLAPFSIDKLIAIWPLKRQVCGRVVKKDPVTGELCGVPGATVRIYDVDINFLWWYPYPNNIWAWLYPLLVQREEIGSVVTDKCGNFCVDIPYFDIDFILRWRLRWRCLWDILKPPRVIDAIQLGVKPDLRAYPQLARLPELTARTQATFSAAPPADDDCGCGSTSPSTMPDIFTSAAFREVRHDLFERGSLFDSVDPDEVSVLEQPAFPHSLAAPALPDNEILRQYITDDKMLEQLHQIRPIVRLLTCWPELVPEWRLFLDVPDIVFKVEQDIDNDGSPEVIYDQGFFDINWNLSEPTNNVIIEAWQNAICVPCGPDYEPCTATGIVGISDMPVAPAYLDSQGYARRVNRPIPVSSPRPDAETPFCGTLRLVGCPSYDQAAFYKIFYRYEGTPETHFVEDWYLFNLSTLSSHHVVPDTQGFYPVLTPPADYFPYHTLLNWKTGNYSNGHYIVRLALYDVAKNPIGPALPTVPLVLDNSKPSQVDFLNLEYRENGGVWLPLPLDCPILERTPGSTIELRVRYHVVADHLRDYGISFSGCDASFATASYGYWHQSVGDNNRLDSWTVSVPPTAHEGGYRFYLEGRSRAFNATGGLASDWYFDPLHIARGNNLHVVILDE